MTPKLALLMWTFWSRQIQGAIRTFINCPDYELSQAASNVLTAHIAFDAAYTKYLKGLDSNG